ncbi:LLM class flavin-dependent oxidoreductase [Pseudonocardia ailaonensis]|uniref:LLM class flavin-dependent oxidoreductase n=1 Tax=Pseudonocardia ailaonensis TaxID=367279 RepID=UPI0031E295C7
MTLRPFAFRTARTFVGTDVEDRVRDYREYARMVDDLGYTTFHVREHYAYPGADGWQWAPVPALMAVLDATTRLRVGTGFTPVSFHHPFVLAQQYATMDQFSGGRVEVGVGAGSMERDFVAGGLPPETPGTRIRRLAEYVEILKGLWRGRFAFEGEFYRIDEIELVPPPRQQPGPPVVIGGHGRKVLGLAGRLAEAVEISPGGPGPFPPKIDPVGMKATASVPHLEKKIEWIRDGAGDRFDELELRLPTGGVVTDRPDEYVDHLVSAHGITAEHVYSSPFMAVGSVDRIVEHLLAVRERYGISSFQVPDAVEFAPVVARLAGT